MSNFKGKNSNKKKEIDFNDEANFQSLVNETVKSKLKNGPKNAGTKAISFITSNAKTTAIFAGYFIVTGIIANGTWIYKGVKFLINLI